MNSANIREVAEGWLTQGNDETITYSLDTTNWGGSPTSVSVDVFNEATGLSVKDTVMPSGSPSVSEDVITLPPLLSLTAGASYRIEVKFTSQGNVLEAFALVACK